MNLVTTIFIFLSAASSPAIAADIPKLSQGLVGLRAELETLNREIDSLQKEKQAELDLWMQKKIELESSLQRESLRQVQLSEKTSRLALRVKNQNKANPKNEADFLKWIARARSWVDFSLPFRREHRLQTLRELEERARRGMESLESLTAELWVFYEDELKMAADNEFRLVDRPTGEASTEKNEVVRLGFFTMFTRNAKGELRQAVLGEKGWVLETIADSSRADVDRLFANMKAKKESGLYSLPIKGRKDLL